MTKPKRPPVRAARRRPVRYSQKLVQKVLDAMATGKTYDQVGRVEGMPCTATIFNWRKAYPEFQAAIDAARSFGAEVCADRALEVADAATEETVRVAKLNVDTLIRRAVALAPERWAASCAARGAGGRREPLEVVFRVRRFEKVVGPDGRTVLREIFPEGEGKP